MKITRTSIFSGIERTLDLPITQEQLAEWEAGGLIQKVMPDLTTSQREFVMTGVTDEEWDNEFGTEEDDDVHDHKGGGRKTWTPGHTPDADEFKGQDRSKDPRW